jgi:2-octaprenyl-3-methyl-6-methoxy-1,4-benzoquinol hydroxylase
MAQFDCVIVGAGMIGSAMAIALADLGLSVVIVDKYAPKDFSENQAFDLRVSAVSIASQQLLTQLGAWQNIPLARLCEYKRLGVWEKGFSYTEFNSDTINQTHLGHIVENRLLQLGLWQQLQQHKNITLLCPEQVNSFSQSSASVIIELTNQHITANILIAADGANSQIRQQANIGITGWDYQQSAMLINVETDATQQNITWQQFLPTGPVAMLPMPGNHASLVWYHQPIQIQRLAGLTNEKLSQAISEVFPKRLGGIKVTNKASFSLTRRHANNYVKNRVILLGDAAHTINPLAGQGVNLGFKDVKAMQMVIADAIGAGECWHHPDVLCRYENARRNDNLLMMTSMDALYASFRHQSPLVKGIRNLALLVTNKVPAIKKQTLAYACGI